MASSSWGSCGVEIGSARGEGRGQNSIAPRTQVVFKYFYLNTCVSFYLNICVSFSYMQQLTFSKKFTPLVKELSGFGSALW